MKRHLLIYLSAVVILFSACSSGEIKVPPVPTLYKAGLDSTFVQVNKTCDTVSKKFTRCDSTIGTYVALVPRTDTVRMHLRLQGDSISADSLKALFGRAMFTGSGSCRLDEYLDFIAIFVGGTTLLILFLWWLKDILISKRNKEKEEVARKRDRDELLDALRKENAAKESTRPSSFGAGCTGGDCALKPLNHILTREITIKETYASPTDKKA
jgi:hypothetical protein